MPIRVVTDSSTNVPDEYLFSLGIIDVPAIVNIDGQSYLNKVELPLEEFYRRLDRAEKMPTTAQPSPAQFSNAYTMAEAEGADEVIAVCVSGKMSGTLNSAIIAAEHARIRVHTWDSMSASVGAGWQAIAAAEMVRDGLDGVAILEKLHGIRARMQTATTPATLRYLIASGRAPRLQGTIGDMLDVKPILSMVNGFLEPVGRARGRRRAVAQMLELIASAIGAHPARVAVGHANVEEEATHLMEMAQSRLNIAESFITDLGPTLTALAGPGLIAIAAYTIERETSHENSR